jgi:hypothetical protein
MPTRRHASRVIATALAVVSALVVAPAASAATEFTPFDGHAKPSQGQSLSTPTSQQQSRQSAATDFASIFSGQNASLANSGWSACTAPIQWTVDARGLSTREAAEQVKNLEWAFSEWTRASGLTFAYAGTQDLAYDDSAFALAPVDGSPVALRHIYLDYVTTAESTRLSGGTVGLGTPSQVMASSKEIVAGDAVFRTDHVKSASTNAVRSLYLHELGHVLGLAHAAVAANVMYPIVTARVHLGTGDVNGVKAMTKPCTGDDV